MINEATRTIEDSQTAQALHGLLSLKADSNSSNFPALLKAVGQHISPGQTPSAAAGSASGSDIQVRASPDVPPAAHTVVVPASDTPDHHMIASAPQTPLAPQQQHQVPKPKAGSVMELLMQMQQSAAQSAQATNSPASDSQATITSPTKLHLPTQTIVTPVKNLSPPTPQTPGSSHTSQTPLAPLIPQAALAQLIQGQSPKTFKDIQTTQLNTSNPTIPVTPPTPQTPKNPTVATILQGIKGQPTLNLPFQIIAAPGGQGQQLILSPSALQVGTPVTSQPILSPPSVVLSAAAASQQQTITTSSTAPQPMRSEEHNKSPLKKRPYPGLSSQFDQTASPQPEKMVKQEPSTTSGSGMQVMSSPALLPAASALLPNPSLAGATPTLTAGLPAATTLPTLDTSAKTVNLVVQNADGTTQTIMLSPQVLNPPVVQRTENPKSNEVSNVFAPMLKSNGEGEPSGTQASNTSNIALNISEGFDSIFRPIKNQVEQLKLGVSGVIPNGGTPNVSIQRIPNCLSTHYKSEKVSLNIKHLVRISYIIRGIPYSGKC